MDTDATDELRPEFDYNVAYTNPKCEFRARASLKAQGFPTFLPTCTKWVKHARKKKKVTRPLFPRYLFVNGAGNLERVRRTDGVEALLTTDGVTASIAGELLQHLSFAEKAGVFDETTAVLRLPPGGLVKIMKGPFAGHIAQLKSADDERRIEVLLDIMNQQTTLQVPLDIVRPMP